MSPLTPTLTEENSKTPIIPGGSFGVVPHFATKVQEALDLVNPEDKDMVIERQMEFTRRKAEVTAHIESLKESQKDYDFSDYGDRLLLSDTEIEDILEEKIFRKDGKITKL